MEKSAETFDTVIRAKNDWFSFDLREVWRYKDLVRMFVKKNFIIQYKQTILGPIWLILNPLLTTVVFTLVFGNFAGLSTEGVPAFLFYMAGNAIWSLFSTGVTGTANTFVLNSQLFGKVYFPRLTYPISQVITSLINFGIQFAMLAVFYAYYLIFGGGVRLTWYALLIPVLLLQCMCLALGVGIIISSLTIKYRDLAIAIGFGIQLWMYATPVVYPLSAVTGTARGLLLANPMTAIVNNFRFALLGTGELLRGNWAVSAAVTAALLVWGVALFSKEEKTFMDTV